MGLTKIEHRKLRGWSKNQQTLKAEKEGSTKNRQARKPKLTSRYWNSQIETGKNQLTETQTKEKDKKTASQKQNKEGADKYRPAEMKIPWAQEGSVGFR